jgi:hypothetical protein
MLEFTATFKGVPEVHKINLVTEVLTLTPNQGVHLTTHKGFDLIHHSTQLPSVQRVR